MQTKLKNISSNLSLDGLEGILDSSPPQPATGKRTADSGAEASQDWTVEETARVLGFSRGAVIRRLEDGILSGYRIKRGSSLVWRVKPSWLADSAAESQTRPDEEENSQSTPVLPDIADTLEAVDTLEAADTGSDTTAPEAFQSTSQNSLPFNNHEFVEVCDVCVEPACLPAFPPGSLPELIELKTKLEMTEFQFQDVCQKLDSANYKIGYLQARLEASLEQIKLLGDSRKQTWWRRWRQWFTIVNH